jgi:hypothetical protein
MSGPRPVRADRGTDLSCLGWPQEAAYRMLHNNLDPEVAERPDDLVVYGGTGRAARSWDAFDAMARTLTTLKADETMLVQSGKPVGVFRTHEWAPRVLLANSNLVPEWGNWDEFRRLEDMGLTMYGQMTAGSWIYIGTQGILQGTYECFAEIGRRKFNGSLRRHHHAHRRPGRHGRRTAAGGHDERRCCAVHRRGRVARAAPRSSTATSTRSPTRWRTPSPAAFVHATSVARCRSGWWATPPICAAAARHGLPGRHRHRPDQRARPPQLCARRPHARGHGGDGSQQPAGTHSSQPREHGHALPSDGGLHGQGQRGVRLRQQPAHGGQARRLRACIRLPGLPPRVHPSAVLRRQGPVPLGGAERRPGRHRRHRPGRAGGVPRRRRAAPVDPDGGRARRVPGLAGAHLLARLRRTSSPRACGSTRWCATAS